MSLVLVNSILERCEDHEMRVHHRSQMEAARLRIIMEKCKAFAYPKIDRQLEAYETLAEEDRAQLIRTFDEGILRDVSDPYDVYRAIMSSVEGSQAQSYFLSAMQHLLLIREDGDVRTRYFQLIDSLVTSVVMDKKAGFKGGLSDSIGVSVARLVAQFGEQDRAQKAEEEAALARSQANQLQAEKEALEEEINRGVDGLIGTLKERLLAAEEKLKVSRQLNETLTGRLEEQARGYEERIDQLHLQINELFKMLRKARGMDFPIEEHDGDGDELDRKELMRTLDRQMERKKAFGKLEGRSPRSTKAAELADGEYFDERDEDDLVDEDDVEIQQRLVRTPQPKRSTRARLKPAGARDARDSGHPRYSDDPERKSQFMDAEEDHVRQHIEETLAAGVENIVSTDSTHYSKDTVLNVRISSRHIGG